MSGGWFGEVSTPTALPFAMLDVVSMYVPCVSGCTSSDRLPASGRK